MALAPNTDNYILGRGVLYFDQFDTSGNKTGELDLGNCVDFKLNLGVDQLEHFSMRTGLKVKDKTAVQQLNATGSFILDEYSKENLVLAFYGEEATLAQNAGVGSKAITVKQGRYFDVGYRKITHVQISGAVEGTDFRVDNYTGRVFIVPGSSALADGASKTVTFDYDDVTYTTIRGFKKQEILGYMRFIGDPAVGPAYEAEIWKANLKPEGDIPFLSDDWGQINFTLTIEKDETNHANEPYFRVVARGEDYGTIVTTTTV
jgi:hypothetical protein